MATRTTKRYGYPMTRVLETYRGFVLTASRGGKPKAWTGFGKGPTVILPRGRFATADAAIADMRDRIDRMYAKGLGVFSKPAPIIPPARDSVTNPKTNVLVPNVAQDPEIDLGMVFSLHRIDRNGSSRACLMTWNGFAPIECCGDPEVAVDTFHTEDCVKSLIAFLGNDIPYRIIF